MAYVIHVIQTNASAGNADQDHWAGQWAAENGHTIIQTRYDDVESALDSAALLGAEVIVGLCPDFVRSAPAPTQSAPDPKGPPIVGGKLNPEPAPAPVKRAKAARLPGVKKREELDRIRKWMLLLGDISAKQCAKQLTENGVALPSGQPGEWQTTQVTRVRKQLKDLYGD